MSRNQNLAAVGLLIAVAAATAIWLGMRGSERARPAAAPGSASAPPAAASGAPTPGSGSPRSRVRRLEDPAARAEILRQVRAVHARRGAPAAAPSSSGTTPAPALPPATIEKEYIRASVRELIPLIVECYEHGLARDPTLGGSIVVDFPIEGEPGVGGVVGESAIDAQASTLTDPEVRECVQETMFGIEIEPPAGGGVVSVRYPFEFRAAAD